nr:chemosensory protein [Liposcelis entomophila]
MKLTIIFGVAILVAVASAAERKQYTAKYDNVDVDRILNNDRILSNYIRCMMDEGPCTQEGRELKKTLPDALSTGCSKCNDRQKGTADRIIRHLMEKRSKDWERLTKKYDPKGEYQKKYDLSNLKSPGSTAAPPKKS